MFSKILIANRGEIACRVIATARRLGISTVAVYSEADGGARHTRLADEAWPIGPAPARQSYLVAEKILDVARLSGAQAIHPGYGFLSENAGFAAACAKAGVVFIGPPEAAIPAMGSKAESKTLMERSGVPLVPGYHGEAQDIPLLKKVAGEIGYPVLIKASAGGGGKGMRIVGSAEEIEAAIEGAKREALASFGDDRVLVEKYLTRPRHIEIQLFADTRGNTVALFERDCSIQRRHQKVLEEAPAPGMDPARRKAMSEAAVAAARAVGYVGAGTVEFIAEGDAFYFMEMNTRLQVEHPVTEMVTGLDLVEWQLRIAMGEKLPLGQDQIAANGHAIEARIYAEDPEKGFLPASGTIRAWREPAGEGIRIDAGFRAGDDISPYYDALLAKLIAWGADRPQALRRIGEALDAFEIGGVTTNLAFLKALLTHPQVIRDDIDTGFIERELSTLTRSAPALAVLDVAAACAAVFLREQGEQVASENSPWDRADGWTLAGRRSRRLSFGHGAERYDAVLWYGRGGLSLEFGGKNDRLQFVPREGGVFDMCLGDALERVSVVWSSRDIDLSTLRGPRKLHWIDPFVANMSEAAAAGRIVAPMPGTVTRILAEPGVGLARGAPVIVLEAMKMEHTLRAPAEGRVKALKCAVGDFVQEGTELAEFEPAAE